MNGNQTFAIKYLIAIGVFFFLGSCQSKKAAISSAKNSKDSSSIQPLWIEMMNDPNVKYYDAVDAFEKYWEHREKPTEDDGEARDIFGKEKSQAEKNEEANRSIEYVYEYKQFLNWQQRNKNLVKPDGTIMKPEEIIEQWKKSNADTLNK